MYFLFFLMFNLVYLLLFSLGISINIGKKGEKYTEDDTAIFYCLYIQILLSLENWKSAQFCKCEDLEMRVSLIDNIEYGLRNKEKDMSQCTWYFSWKFYGLIPMSKKWNADNYFRWRNCYYL